MTGEHAEQRGLAGAVRADDAHDATARQAERQVVEQQAVAESLAQTVGLDDQVAQALARWNVDFVRLVALLEFLRLQFFETLQARLALGLPRLRVLAHPFQFLLQGLAEALLLLLFRGETLLFLLQPRGVVALPRNAVAAVQFQNPAGDVVEEVAVVGHGDDGARVGFQELFEPSDGLGVEVVGGFVQQEHVRLRHQQTTQRNAALLTTGEVCHAGLPRRQAQCVGGHVQRAVQVVAVGGGEDAFQFSLAGRELVEVRVFVRVGGVDLV